MNCEHCRIGHLQPITIPYIQWLNSQILVIPDANASSCDVCGYMAYDAGFIYKLNALLAEFSEKPQATNLSHWQMAPTVSSPWPSTGKS